MCSPLWTFVLAGNGFLALLLFAVCKRQSRLITLHICQSKLLFLPYRLVEMQNLGRVKSIAVPTLHIHHHHVPHVHCTHHHSSGIVRVNSCSRAGCSRVTAYRNKLLLTGSESTAWSCVSEELFAPCQILYPIQLAHHSHSPSWPSQARRMDQQGKK